MRYDKHIFICTNRREPGHPRGCCIEKGSEAVRDALKAAVKERGLASRVRVNTSGCLDACEFGVSIVIYPDDVWYGGVTLDDVNELVDSHLVNDLPVDRLRIRDKRYTPESVLATIASDDNDAV